MFLPIVVYGHPILRKISEDITPEYPELDKFIRDLFQTMDEADGVGLAAPQVGRNIRIFVVDANAFEEMDPDCKGFRKAFINAHILEVSGEEVSMEEGCLSLPGIHESASPKTSNAPTVYESAIWTSKDKNTKRSFAVLKPGSSNTNTITWKVFCLQIICLL